MTPVVVIDYGMGNLRSIANALKSLGAQVEVSTHPDRVAAAERLVLPGVGAFGQSMAELEHRALREAIAGAIQRGRPFLGICLGFQVLFESSNEHGDYAGLGLVKGHVRNFDHTRLVVPHMGWNALHLAQAAHPLVAGLAEGVPMYFVHSFRPIQVAAPVTLTTTPYGGDFVSGVACDNLAGVQFHPEKSGREGLRLLSNFLAWKP